MLITSIIANPFSMPIQKLHTITISICVVCAQMKLSNACNNRSISSTVLVVTAFRTSGTSG